jgi:hypothetical protein
MNVPMNRQAGVEEVAVDVCIPGVRRVVLCYMPVACDDRCYDQLSQT